jgi:hypothetical protein
LVIVDERKIRPQAKEVGPYRRDPKYQLVNQILNRKPKRPVRAWQKVWRTLRHLRRATRSDLIRLTGCGYRTVEQYTVLLAKHGYIKAVGAGIRKKYGFSSKMWGRNRQTGTRCTMAKNESQRTPERDGADQRRRDLAAIHISKKRLGMDETAYREMLLDIAGVESAADLDYVGRKKVLDRLRGNGLRRAPDKARAPGAHACPLHGSYPLPP